MNLWITVRTRSETAAGAGSGLAGLVDREVQYDRWGLPFLGGRRVKGLLRDAARQNERLPGLLAVERVFGTPGSREGGALTAPDLELEGAVETRRWIEQAGYLPEEVLGALTGVRAQTRLEDGVAKDGTLRQTRVVRRGLTFTGRLTLTLPDAELEAGLCTLALACAAWQRAGLSRGRGPGRLDTACYLDAGHRIDAIAAALATVHTAINRSPAGGGTTP